MYDTTYVPGTNGLQNRFRTSNFPGVSSLVCMCLAIIGSCIAAPPDACNVVERDVLLQAQSRVLTTLLAASTES